MHVKKFNGLHFACEVKLHVKDELLFQDTVMQITK